MQPWSKVSRMNIDDLKRMQDALLVDLLKEEIPKHPYYSRLFENKGLNLKDITGTEDLLKIPFTTKMDMYSMDGDITGAKRFVLEQPATAHMPAKSNFLKIFQKNRASLSPDPDPYRLVQLFYTAGRTGEPVPLLYSNYDLENLKEMGLRAFDMWNLTRDNTLINALSYAPNVSYWSFWHATLSLGSTAMQSGGGRTIGTEKILRALFGMEASVLVTFPGYADYCLSILNTFGFSMPNLEVLIVGMDDTPISLINRLQEGMEKINAKDNQVYRIYFLSEAKGGWPECAPGYGYHVHPDHAFVEIVDPETGERKNEGEPGEIVVTNLDVRGTLLLRFRSGDLATEGITYQPCPNCKRTTPRILGNIERLAYYFNLKNKNSNVVFNFNEMRRLLFAQKILKQWHVEIYTGNTEDFLKLVVCPVDGLEEEKLIQELEKEVKPQVNVPVEITCGSHEDIIERQNMLKGITECRVIDLRKP